jgi:hypothetical protein
MRRGDWYSERGSNAIRSCGCEDRAIEAFRQRTGWRSKQMSSFDSDFNYDFLVLFRREEIACGEVYCSYILQPFQRDAMSETRVFYIEITGMCLTRLQARPSSTGDRRSTPTHSYQRPRLLTRSSVDPTPRGVIHRPLLKKGKAMTVAVSRVDLTPAELREAAARAKDAKA